MSLVNLKSVLSKAYKNNYAVAGFVVLGWEEARAYVEAGEALNAPVILQAGPNARNHMPMELFASMFRYLGERAKIDVVAHLDHATNVDVCRHGIKCGFTSIMYDGSSLPLAENIKNTAEIVSFAHDRDISVEAELGFVGYHHGKTSIATNPYTAVDFVNETQVDALAISIGNTHLQENNKSKLNIKLLNEIEKLIDVPLVLHGGSGIDFEQRAWLAKESNICKINIGTELRMLFGQSLRRNLVDNQQEYDRIKLLKPTEIVLKNAAIEIINSLNTHHGIS